MSKPKQSRRQVPAPDPRDELATLQFLFFRADYLRLRWLETSHDAVGAGSQLSLEDGYGIPVWVFVTLHLASLYTVVEGWKRLGRSDTAIDQLLGDAGKLEQLHDLRDGVFHFGATNNPGILNVLGDRVMLRWAGDLHNAFAKHLSTGEPSDAA